MTKRKGIGSHQSAKMKKDEWLTPPFIFSQLPKFDLDPCSPVGNKWVPAYKHYTIEDDGLSKDWDEKDFIWCNPPYGLVAAKWLEKLSSQGNGIALIFARTETRMFFDWVWDKADGIFFFKGRLYFHHVDGKKAKANAGAPSVLVAYGKKANKAIQKLTIEGKYINLKKK